jgi:hypothetical protein
LICAQRSLEKADCQEAKENQRNVWHSQKAKEARKW